jgi:hypothetical protein
MTYNNDLNQLNNLWKAVEEEETELHFPIPNGPQSPQGAVPIPISSAARQKAAGMANFCRNEDLKETMRRNLLATIALHDYLSLQGYLPDLEASDCWNPILGRTGEVADLVVSQVGHFECCAIDPGKSSCSVPMEGQFGRSGYVAVEMDAEERWGWLLGFMPCGNEVDPIEILNRESLHSMDEFGYLLHRLWLLWSIVQERAEPWDPELRSDMVALLERIYRAQPPAQRPMRAAAEMTHLLGEDIADVDHNVTKTEGRISEMTHLLAVDVGGTEPIKLTEVLRGGNNPADSKLQQFLRGIFDQFEDALVDELEGEAKRVVDLSQWLKLEKIMPVFRGLGNQIREGWQNLDSLFSAEELPTFSMRSNLMQRGKLIRLASEVMRQTIILVVKVNPQSEKDTNVIAEVHPRSGQRYLPEMLQVKVLDDQQKAVMEAIASSTNQNIRFDFNVVSGERFSVQMILEGASVIEEFVV